MEEGEKLDKFYKVIEQHLTEKQMEQFYKIEQQKQALFEFAMVQKHKETVEKGEADGLGEKEVVEAWLEEVAKETFDLEEKWDPKLEEIEKKLHTYEKS